MTKSLARVHAHLAKLYATPPKDDAEAIASGRRLFYSSSLVEGLVPDEAPGVIVEAASVGGVPGEWLRPAAAGGSGRLMYIHGGGWVAGTAASYRHMTSWLAAESGLGTLAVDYRLAPEHRFPAGLDDCLAAWRGLVRAQVPGPLFLAGDSAGGNLALALALELKRLGERLPDAMATIGACTDFTMSGESYQTRLAVDRSVTPAAVALYARNYLPAGQDPQDPRVSPLFGDLAGLPPLLMHVGDFEVLLDDTLRFAAKAEAAGVAVTTQVWPESPHVAEWWHHILPEGRQSLHEIGRFFRARV